MSVDSGCRKSVKSGANKSWLVEQRSLCWAWLCVNPIQVRQPNREEKVCLHNALYEIMMYLYIPSIEDVSRIFECPFNEISICEELQDTEATCFRSASHNNPVKRWNSEFRNYFDSCSIILQYARVTRVTEVVYEYFMLDLKSISYGDIWLP